jgi:hypothetical protein
MSGARAGLRRGGNGFFTRLGVPANLIGPMQYVFDKLYGECAR